VRLTAAMKDLRYGFLISGFGAELASWADSQVDFVALSFSSRISTPSA